MPANSNAVRAKKARKKPKAPQVIASEVWLAVEKAVCAGMGYSQAARTFGIRSPHAIIMRSRRDKWPVPSRVEERARQLQESLQRRSVAAEQRRDGNEITTETLAQSWAEKGEAHRHRVRSCPHRPSRSRQERACQSRVGVMLIWPIKAPGAMLGSMTPMPTTSQSGWP